MNIWMAKNTIEMNLFRNLAKSIRHKTTDFGFDTRVNVRNGINRKVCLKCVCVCIFPNTFVILDILFVYFTVTNKKNGKSKTEKSDISKSTYHLFSMFLNHSIKQFLDAPRYSDRH